MTCEFTAVTNNSHSWNQGICAFQRTLQSTDLNSPRLIPKTIRYPFTSPVTYVQPPPPFSLAPRFLSPPPTHTPPSPPLVLPLHNQRQNIKRASQSALAPIGGNFSPSFSMRGSHVHHCSRGVDVITDGMWLPQPHQVCFSIFAKHIALAEKGWCGERRGRGRGGDGGDGEVARGKG